jgi:hypothetical protein
MLPEDGSTEPKHVAIKRTPSNLDSGGGGVEEKKSAIYSFSVHYYINTNIQTDLD